MKGENSSTNPFMEKKYNITQHNKYNELIIIICIRTSNQHMVHSIQMQLNVAKTY